MVFAMGIERIRKSFDTNCPFCAVRLKEWEDMEKEFEEAYARMHDGIEGDEKSDTNNVQSPSKNSINDANL